MFAATVSPGESSSTGPALSSITPSSSPLLSIPHSSLSRFACQTPRLRPGAAHTSSAVSVAVGAPTGGSSRGRGGCGHAAGGLELTNGPELSYFLILLLIFQNVHPA